MRPVPFTDPLAAIVYWSGFVAWMLAERAMLRRSRPAVVATGGQDPTKWILMVGMWAGISVASALAASVTSAAIQPLRVPVFVLGMALMAAGVMLRCWAVVVLGRFFTYDVRVAMDQTVIDRGPYRILRHPAYAANLLVCLGIGVALGNWLALCAAIVLPVAAHLPRIIREERVLASELGEPYARYAASHRRIVPGVW